MRRRSAAPRLPGSLSDPELAQSLLLCLARTSLTASQWDLREIDCVPKEGMEETLPEL
jgi:hypothetical protein